MSNRQHDERSTPGRRIQLKRRLRSREAYVDTTVTDSWPPRLNTQL
jgi:hypothetical protein